MSDKKTQRNVLIAAAFLMGSSAVGPGFLTQTANFTQSLGPNFGFVILLSLVLALIVQLNVWRVIGVSGMRGQDIANKLLPGLGYFVAFLIALGGLAFNIANVGGASLGLNVMFGIDIRIGYFISALAGIYLFLSKYAKSLVDRVMQYMGLVMIAVTMVVAFTTKPPVGDAIIRTVMPDAVPATLFFPILTLLGGTVGGYITFAGAHRLLDSGVKGTGGLSQINKGSVMGISIAAIMRVLLFLAVLGVVTAGNRLDPSNPAASAFRFGAGEIGYRFSGLVLFCAAMTSVIGAAYTSVSFLKTLSPVVMKFEKYFIVGFIAVSTAVVTIVGSPAKLLVLVGFLNGLILPITLTIMLIASRRKDIVGEEYKHPVWLILLGIIVVGVTAYLSITGFPGMLANLRA
jgi:Mn2+/Fe2+ NRAMP family transporter